jgi:hypothetical protein
MLRRGLWDEVELADEPDALIMVHPGWTADRESLALALRETGWFAAARPAFEAAESAELKWGWIGDTDERTVVICDSQGLAAGTGEVVNDIAQVTLARIGNDA